MAQYQTPHIFDAEIVPALGMSLPGFAALLGLQFAMGGSLGAFFIIKGAWPVALFLLGGFVITIIAFAVYYWYSRRVERVRLSRFSLAIEDIDHRGRRTTWCFDPAKVRLHLVPGDWPPNKLYVSDRRETIEIARDLSPAERLDIYNALDAALAHWRGDARYTSSACPAQTGSVTP
jgi:uncharacterized membrane protein